MNWSTMGTFATRGTASAFQLINGTASYATSKVVNKGSYYPPSNRRFIPGLEPEEEKRSLSPPQFSFLLFVSVWIAYAVHFGSAVRQGLESSLCAEYFTASESCKDSDLFFLEQFRQAIIGTVGFVFAMSLLCWGNNPLHQRMNVFLAQGLGATAFVIVCQSQVLEVKHRARMMLTFLAVAASIFVGIKSGIQVSLPVKLSSPFNFWAIVSTVASTLGLSHFLYHGAESFTTFASSEITDGGRLIFNFAIVQYATRVLLLIFGVFYLNSGRKSIMLLAYALTNIYQYSMWQQEHVRDFDALALYVLSTAVLSLIFAFAPEGSNKSQSQTKKAVRR